VEGETGIGKSQLIRNFYRITAANSAAFRTIYVAGMPPAYVVHTVMGLRFVLADEIEKRKPFAVWGHVLDQGNTNTTLHNISYFSVTGCLSDGSSFV
jgi:hypothetical protein